MWTFVFAGKNCDVTLVRHIVTEKQCTQFFSLMRATNSAHFILVHVNDLTKWGSPASAQLQVRVL